MANQQKRRAGREGGERRMPAGTRRGEERKR
jgi:hypothetical protein